MGMKDIQSNSVVVATPIQVDRIRYPEQLYTDGYLDDPIKFKTDSRFQPKTIVDQLNVLPNQVIRDRGQFLRVNEGIDDKQYVSINLYSTVWSRSAYTRVISADRRSFKQLSNKNV